MAGRGTITFKELYYTRAFRHRLLSALSDDIFEVVICSPFFNKLPSPFGSVIGFCRHLQIRGREKIQIITRPPGRDASSMQMDVAKILTAQGVELFIRAQPFHHAKMYHFEYKKGFFRSFIGSANFTMGGLERNYELVVEMEGVGDASPCHREIKRMLETGGALTYHAWIAKGQPEGQEEQR
jgi:phosphatidylserine/phosphatidylglycerophosphate/cardiolipin synthase-like enzyme